MNMKPRTDISLNTMQTINGKRTEFEILNKMHEKIFTKVVLDSGLHLEYIFVKTKLCIQDRHRFNLLLRKLKKHHGIHLYESILFMENYYVKFKKILSILDDENNCDLKKELSKKHNIVMMTNKLHNFLPDDGDRILLDDLTLDIPKKKKNQKNKLHV